MIEANQLLIAKRPIQVLKSDDNIYLDCSNISFSKHVTAIIDEGTAMLVVAPAVNAPDYVGVFVDGMFCLIHQTHVAYE
jgi:hypothetical protein